jgi:hypothetical protein
VIAFALILDSMTQTTQFPNSGVVLSARDRHDIGQWNASGRALFQQGEQALTLVRSFSAVTHGPRMGHAEELRQYAEKFSACGLMSEFSAYAGNS